jgi:hypothetical protein
MSPIQEELSQVCGVVSFPVTPTVPNGLAPLISNSLTQELMGLKGRGLSYGISDL